MNESLQKINSNFVLFLNFAIQNCWQLVLWKVFGISKCNRRLWQLFPHPRAPPLDLLLCFVTSFTWKPLEWWVKTLLLHSFLYYFILKNPRKIDGSINKLIEQHKKFLGLLSFARKYMLKYSICCHSHGHATWLISHCLQWFQRCLILAVLQPSREFQLERRDFCLTRRESCLERQDSCLAWGWQLTFERYCNVELANAK